MADTLTERHTVTPCHGYGRAPKQGGSWLSVHYSGRTGHVGEETG